MAELIIQSGKLKGKRLVLPAKEMVVGRDDDCDLRIASSLVSRRHCVLKSMTEGILVTDLASQNGTYINDVPISEPTVLREGDMLRIGATVFAVPMASKPKTGQPIISDADIADWLTDSRSNFSGTDTAVLGTYVPASLSQTPIPGTSTPTPVPPRKTQPAPPTKPQLAKVLSVKDEAAIVIQKHWESLKARQTQ